MAPVEAEYLASPSDQGGQVSIREEKSLGHHARGFFRFDGFLVSSSDRATLELGVVHGSGSHCIGLDGRIYPGRIS